ncbi:DEAD/DEAH box helicase family protein [Gemmata sp. JC673]|uniref:DEAD/DEAH box helicase family protein n=1 Tax=Gemmata algarum TaxID=2975278 RepID=A0ABU5EY16_9BACT|nr:DEAD/DEAH box helicase family protein [Gemmata algarum]MDY3558581.1 DEAD/DEAH box helicase family protein [Gemmata algarum]
MPPVVIENPILNSPFEQPARHFRFDDANNITADVVEGRRSSSYFMPIAAPKKKSKQTIDFGIKDEKKTETEHVNKIRAHVKTWRRRGWPETTSATLALLRHWTAPQRERRLFFCQVEALETLIFVSEVAKNTKYGHTWIEDHLKRAAVDAGTDLFRMAFKMATGSGKTVVMSMLIAWQVLNKRRNPRDPRFTDSFLVVAPGITIRDRLRVLRPADDENYYRKLDIVPRELLPELGAAKIAVTNFHAFKPREKGDAGGLTKRVLTANTPGAFTESADEMVRRVVRELGTSRELLVINDEAHHCYRSRPPHEGEDKLKGEDKKEADAREEEARLWLTGLEAVNRSVGVKAVYDLSATPFYLKGSGYPEGTLFPWVVSDFALIDAIESGIVKIPRVPVADNAMTGEFPKYRNLWVHIRESLPKKNVTLPAAAPLPPLPADLQGALESLYDHYKRQHADWEADQDGRANGRTPPVFIVVCNNTAVSKMLYEYIAGRETGNPHADGTPIVKPGNLDIFNNVQNQRWRHRPNTILVDSRQFESDAGMSDDFKKLAAHQIDDFKHQYKRSTGRDVENLTDEDLMREVLNTVGKPGKLGEGVKCVVSVSMLTEGWDCNTVTHVLGVRAFGTQLLCEQVVGRGLRRASYALNEKGHFDPEYADVYGVPFSFIPCAGVPEEGEKKIVQKPGNVKAVPERLLARPWLEVKFPRVVGYRYEALPGKLDAKFGPAHRMKLTTEDIATRTENAPKFGTSTILTLDARKATRPQTVVFALATHLQQHHFAGQVWLFPQLLAIVRDWFGDPDGDSPNVDYGDETFPGLLLFDEKKHEAAEKIRNAIIAANDGAHRLRAELPGTDRGGTTVGVMYDTVKKTWTTDATKCHLNLVPEDSGWETQFVQRIERMDEVKAYVKNQNLGFTIPYTCEGRPGNYYPDYILKIDDGRGTDDLLHLVVEVTGEKKAEKAAKVTTAGTLWVPAVNNEVTFGRWAFLEIDADNRHKPVQTILKFLKTRVG